MSDEGGSALVELAIGMPLILLLIFGAFQIVFLISTKTLFDHAAFEGARTAAVHDERTKVVGRINRVLDAVPRGPGFLASEPDVLIDRRGDTVSVRVNATVGLLPFFRQLASGAGADGTIEFAGSAQVRQEPWTGFSGLAAE